MATLKDILCINGRPVCATDPQATVSQAIEHMCKNHVRALLVGELDDPIGILSERDVLERVLRTHLNPDDTPVESVMTTPLVSLPEDSAPAEALAFMCEHRLHQVPIVSEEAVIGVISSTDLLRWATHAQESEIRALQDYCSGKYPG
jgi:CBS domain-containing protein